MVIFSKSWQVKRGLTREVHVGACSWSPGSLAWEEGKRVCPGLNFSVEFRRNSVFFFVFASYREEKFRYFSPFFVFKFKNSKIFIKNSKKI